MAHAKELLLPLLLLLAQLRAGQTYSLLFSAFSPSLCAFFFPFILCHSINPNSSLFCFLCLLLFLSLTECCCGSACSTICDKKSSETMQTESWRELSQGWHLSPFPSTESCLLLSFLSLHHHLLLPLSDNTPTQMCMHL